MHPTLPRSGRLALLAAVAAAGCASLIGLPDYGPGGSGTAGAGGTGGKSTGTGGKSTGTRGASGTGASGTGGHEVGSGGSGAAATTASTGGGAPACVEGCYAGLDGTEGVGDCAGGTCDGGVCGDTRPTVQQCSGGDQNCDGIVGCTGVPRWQGSVPATTSSALAAGPDGTVVLAGASTAAAGMVVAAFDARGRSCWGPTPVPFDGGCSSACLAVNAVALSGAKTSPPGGPVAQVVCGGTGGPSPLAASTIVAGTVNPPVTFVSGMPQPGAGNADAFIARLDPTGKVVWGQAFGSGGIDDADAVAADDSGNIYVTGRAADPLTVLPCTGDPGPGFDAGSPGIGGAFVAQVHADGTCGWVKHFQGPGRGTGIAVDGSGNVVVSGELTSAAAPVDFDGQLLTGAPGKMGFIVKLAPDGTVNGAPTAMDCAGDPVYVALTPQGAALALCQSVAGAPCAGNAQSAPVALLWNVDAGSFSCYVSTAGPALPEGLAIDRAGNIVVLLATGGPVTSPDWGSNPIAVGGLVAFKLAGFGQSPVWGYAWGAGNTFAGYGLAVDGMGDVAIGVTPTGALPIAPFTLAAGTGDVVELAP